MAGPLVVLAFLAAFAGSGGTPVEGRVVDADGAPIGDAEVAVVAWIPAGGEHWRIDGGVVAVRTAEDGSFRIAGPEDAIGVLIGARAKGRTPVVTDPVVLARESPLRIVLSPGRTLTVRIVDHATRRPVAGAKILVYPRHNHNGPHVRQVFAWHFGNPGGVFALVADSEGRATADDFPSGVFNGEAVVESGSPAGVRVTGRADHLIRFPQETELLIETRPDPLLDGNGRPLPPYAAGVLGTGRWSGHGSRAAIAFSADGSLLVCGVGRAFFALDAGTGLGTGVLGTSGGDVRGVAASRDGAVAASVSEDGLLVIGDPSRPSVDARRKVRVCKRPLFAVALVDDGRVALTGGDDGVLRRHDCETGKLLGSEDLGRGPITALATRPDGEVLVAAGPSVLRRDGGIRELANVRPLVLSLAVSPDGRRVAAGAWGRVVILDGETGETLREIPLPGGAQALDLGADGTLAIGTSDGKVRLVRDGAPGWEADGNPRAVRSVAISPDGTRVFAGGEGPGLRILDADGTEIPAAPGHFGPVNRVAHSPVAAVAASGGLDGDVLIWDLESRALLHRIHAHAGPVRRLAFSSDGKCVRSGADGGEVRTWLVGTGREAAEDAGRDFRPAKPREVGADLAARIDRMLASGARARAVSPDGRTLVTGQESGVLLLWDLSRITD